LFYSALRFDEGAILDLDIFQDISDREENARMPLAIRCRYNCHTSGESFWKKPYPC
jgi:hypothetical protein